MSAIDRHDLYMQRCLDLAVKARGHVSPNPLVGAVLVNRDGDVVGEGWHQNYGGPHAEVFALESAKQKYPTTLLREATLYVNLEPCCHHGKTPPCTDLVRASGVGHVVVGMEDPNPVVSGRGILQLRDAGVDVCVGVLEAECRQLNAHFVHRVRRGRPYIILKIAQTLDGFVATSSGESQWITDEPARTLVHQWRSWSDAVLVGAGTARHDDPRLTVRHVTGPQPMRIVLDRKGVLPARLGLLNDEHVVRTVVVTAEESDPPYAKAFEEAGGKLLRVPLADNHLDLNHMFSAVASSDGPLTRPIQTVLVEAGPALAGALVQSDLVDELRLFVSPHLLGDGVPSFILEGVERLTDRVSFASHMWTQVGPDMLFTGVVHNI